jgi:hypothetical protein
VTGGVGTAAAAVPPAEDGGVAGSVVDGATLEGAVEDGEEGVDGVAVAGLDGVAEPPPADGAAPLPAGAEPPPDVEVALPAPGDEVAGEPPPCEVGAAP